MDTPILKKDINAAADAHALEELGQQQYEDNKDARMAIMDTFKEGVTWATKMLLQLNVIPGDQAHRLIAKERLTNISRGFDADHDDQYTEEELNTIAILLLADGSKVEPFLKGIPWPVKGYPDKRGKLDTVRTKVIAGQFAAAEIDRLIRAASPKKESEVTTCE